MEGKTFIDNVMEEAKTKNYKVENWLIDWEIETAKELIQKAVKEKKNSVAWWYEDGYESVLRIDDIPEWMDTGLGVYLQNDRVWFRDIKNFIEYVAIWVHDVPEYNPLLGIDYKYLTGNLEEKLEELGCKSVYIYVEPKTVKRMGKEGKIFKRDVITGEEHLIQWAVRISW